VKLTAFCSLALMLSSCSKQISQSPSVSSAPSNLVTVAVATPERHPLSDTLDLTGTVEPYEKVTVYARAAGYLKSLKVDIGDRVNKGQIVAELDVPEMQTALEEKRAALAKAEALAEQARAAIDQNRAEAEFAQVNYKRLKAIHDRDADLLPQQEVDQARVGLQVAESKQKSAGAQIKSADASVAAVRAEIATLQTLKSYAIIEAPLSGIVTERFVDPGALVQAASNSRTQAAPLITIAGIDRLRVLFDVPEPSVASVHAGTAARITASSLPAETFEGSIARTGGVLDPASRSMRVEVDLANPNGRLRPGMTARVSLVLRNLPEAITVPPTALRLQGVDRVIYIVQGDVAKAIKVKTGLEGPNWVQISAGLKGNESIIVASAGTLKDGDKVMVR